MPLIPRCRFLLLVINVTCAAELLIALPAIPRQQFTAAQLVGEWISEPYITQLGKATAKLCFTNFGTYRLHFVSQGGKADDYGRYKLEGASVTLTGAGRSDVYIIRSLSRRRLMLVENGELRTYRRVAARCESKR
jgi:hypothetical protein